MQNTNVSITYKNSTQKHLEFVPPRTIDTERNIGKQRLRVTSQYGDTFFIISEGGGGTAFLIKGTAKTYEEAITNLFKSLIMDDREHAIRYFELVKDFFIDHFSSPFAESYKAVLSGKWKGLFLHLEVERTKEMDPSLMFFRVHDKEIMKSLHHHPLAAIFG